MVTLVWCALAPLALLLPTAPRWFVLGIWFAAIAAIVVHATVILSGSAYLVNPDQGEQWTREELDRIRRLGWKVIHRVFFKAGEDTYHICDLSRWLVRPRD